MRERARSKYGNMRTLNRSQPQPAVRHPCLWSDRAFHCLSWCGNLVLSRSCRARLTLHMAADLYANGRASVDGLQSRSYLNGCDCTLLAWHGESGRWAVKVHNTGEHLRLKPSNLIAGHNSWAAPADAIQPLLKPVGWNDRAHLGATCKSWRLLVATHNSQLKELAYL